jgi:pimeloyl-ACP methyl ester carboxylesterase
MLRIMNRSKLTVAAIVLIPIAAFGEFSAMRYFSADREHLTLDDAARAKAPGQFIRLSEGVTHYEAGGPEGGTPLLLVPGFSTPYNVWDPTFEGLTKAGIRVIRFELYGRGLSDRPDARYDGDFFDRQILDLVDALRLGKVDIAGLSMGGPIAATFANRHPERVRRVVLLDPGWLSGARLPLGLRAPLLGDYNFAVTLAPGLPNGQWKDFLYPERYPHYLDRYHEQMQYHGFRRAILRTLRNYVAIDSTSEYAALGRSGKPVLLVWGKQDKDVPFAISSKVLDVIPQARFFPVEDAAHIPHFEHPELVNPVIVDFLQGASAHD